MGNSGVYIAKSCCQYFSSMTDESWVGNAVSLNRSRWHSGQRDRLPPNTGFCCCNHSINSPYPFCHIYLDMFSFLLFYDFVVIFTCNILSIHCQYNLHPVLKVDTKTSYLFVALIANCHCQMYGFMILELKNTQHSTIPTALIHIPDEIELEWFLILSSLHFLFVL